MNDTTGQSRLPCGFLLLFGAELNSAPLFLYVFLYVLRQNQRRDHPILWKINLFNAKKMRIRKKKSMPDSRPHPEKTGTVVLATNRFVHRFVQ